MELFYSTSLSKPFGKELTIDIFLLDFSVNSTFLGLVSICYLACKIHCLGDKIGLCLA